MKSLKEYVTTLNEVLITFGNKPYPKFGHVVILAGGAGSGKGFIRSKLLGISGKVLDPDRLKLMAIKSKKISDEVKKEFGVDLKDLDLKRPGDTFKLHDIIGNALNLVDKEERALFSSILEAPADRKPNIIFDRTLRDLAFLESVTRTVQELGYDKKNIHIVWVLNKFEVAADQNKRRERVVPEEILLSTHEGAALTMKKILDMGDKLSKYMDGDIHIAWNQAEIDSEYIEGNSKKSGFLKKSDYLTVKRSGKPQKSSAQLGDAITSKIKSYVPKINIWETKD